MKCRVLPILMSALVTVGYTPCAFAGESEPQLNFKIYSPDAPAAQPAPATPQVELTPQTAKEDTPQEAEQPAAQDKGDGALSGKEMAKETADSAATSSEEKPAATAETPAASETPAAAATEPDKAQGETAAAPSTTDATANDSKGADGQPKQIATRVLQGYVRVVPSGTKIPIIMDTAVDSDTSQEGDEFSARTSEDLDIDGHIAVPAGSIIKGRIAQLTGPRHLGRSGSVALKFDTVTTPDNRQIPLVANLVARGGVVHARRGLKDIAIDTSIFTLPMVIGIGIGALAGGSSSSTSTTSGTTTSTSHHIGRAGGALIGAGIGAAVGIAVLCAKKGKKVDVRPGDELKIELAEDLRMPMM